MTRRDDTDAAGTGVMRAGIVRSLKGLLARYPGVTLGPLLERAGLSEAQLVDADTFISLARVVTLLEDAARVTGDAHFAHTFAAQMPWTDLGVLGYVLMHSPTAGAAFGNLQRYFAIQQSVGGVLLEVRPREARMVRTPAPAAAAGNLGAELVITLYARLVRDGTGDAGWTPQAVHFRHRRPRSTATLDRYFRAPLHFGAPHDALVFTPADLRRPFRTADAGLLPILLQHADASLARAPGAGELSGDVRRLVIAALGGGAASLEHVAAALGLSERSLQRHLRDAGLSFQALVAEARLDLARRYVADPALTLTEAAFLLGYGDLSAFSRAFRRWTGKSPLAFRRRHAMVAPGA